MPAMTDILENLIINHLLRNGAHTPPATIYAGLFTAAPVEAGTGGTEVSGGSYARVAVTLGAGSAGATDNTGTITFPTATANWGTVIGLGIFDASTSGNLYMYAALNSSQVVNNGGTFSIATGNLDISFD